MLREQLYFEDVVYRVDGLLVFSNLKEDPMIKRLREISEVIVYNQDMKGAYEKYYDLANMLVCKAEAEGFSGNLFKQYVIDLFMKDVNALSLACENGRLVKDSTLYAISLKDISTLQFLMDFDLKNICENIGYNEKIYDYQPVVCREHPDIDLISTITKADDILQQLILYYSSMGCGILATNKVFGISADHTLLPCKNERKISLSNLFGYTKQKSQILANTDAFIKGKKAENLLLIGPPGTGKSTFLRGAVQKFLDNGVKMIEVEKHQLISIESLIQQLELRGHKFIICITGISYYNFEEQYRYISRLLNPMFRNSNILVYGTCNSDYSDAKGWGEKKDADKDYDKIVPVDVFDQVVVFAEMGEKEYLDVVIGLARLQNLRVPEGFLIEQALEWRKKHASFTGNDAKQFVESIAWELKQQ